MMCVPGNSEIPGIYSYSVVRRTPHKTHLFYLCPIESKKEQQSGYGIGYTAGGTFSWTNNAPNWMVTGGDLTGTSITSYIINTNSYPTHVINAPPAPAPAPAPVFRDDNYWPDPPDYDE